MTKKEKDVAAKCFSLFHSQTRDEKECDKCHHKTEKKVWTSFKMNEIQKELHDFTHYNAMSDVLNKFRADDYAYDAVFGFLEYLLENGDDGDMNDLVHEFADAEVDVYTHDLTAWLHSDIWNVAYLDDAVAEFGSDVTNVLTLAQYMFYRDIGNEVVMAIDELKTNE